MEHERVKDVSEARIWSFLKGKGLSDFGAAGLMGNLYAESGLKPECAAVFVADGVRYTLSGHVTQQTMRAIVDSMSYA